MELASTPSVVFDTDTIHAALGSEILVRFIFVLECDQLEKKSINLARFNIGGTRANRDPTKVPLNQLFEVSRNNHGAIDLRKGWSKLHHFIYVLGHHTDEHGW